MGPLTGVVSSMKIALENKTPPVNATEVVIYTKRVDTDPDTHIGQCIDTQLRGVPRLECEHNLLHNSTTIPADISLNALTTLTHLTIVNTPNQVVK